MFGKSSRRRNSVFSREDALSLIEEARFVFFLVADWDLPRLGGREVDRDRGIVVVFLLQYR